MTFFLKKLNAHELGYRGGVPAGAGQFLLIPKYTISFFPSMNRTIPNDGVNLSINGISLLYIYHNSKHSIPNPNVTRDEYRLYINSHIKSSSAPFSPEDIILLIYSGIPNSYQLFYFSTTHHLYSTALTLLNNSPSKSAKLLSSTLLGSLGITSTIGTITRIVSSPIDNTVLDPIVGSGSTLETILKTTERKPLTAEVLAYAFKKNIIEEEEKRTEIIEGSKIGRNVIFRRVVLELYDYKCAIKKDSTSFVYGNLCNLEAAHIVPKEYKGGDHPSNGISLSRDLHWAFDKGFFTIDTDYKIIVHQALLEQSSPLNEIHGQSIFIPDNELARPNEEALNWRKENIFGRFFRS